jgi:hypothetical protein
MTTERGIQTTEDETELLLKMAIQGAHSLMIRWQEKLHQAQEPPKKRISDAGKEAISKAQRARWDALRKKSKRKLSPEGRQAIINATKKRWDRERALTDKTDKKKKSSSATA